MVKGQSASALKEYFTACFLAVLTAFAGLTRSDGPAGRGIFLIVLIALFMVVFVYFQLKRQVDDQDQSIEIPLSRLQRMAILWYILTIAFGGALVKDLVQTDGSAENKMWTLSILGLAAGGFALVRLIRILSRKRG